mmetsp:Transcript_15938/g.18797  ORF Transcript_15938/g.18797 Transcript_15938/m.18797 type:complete len:101 (+) Transcript_15938:274-576(+)
MASTPTVLVTPRSVDYKPNCSNIAQNEVIRVLGTLTWVQQSHNSKYIRISVKYPDETDEVNFNIFENDVFKFFGFRLPHMVRILRAVNGVDVGVGIGGGE